ncbi:hypothetical protein Agub_g2019, partial [Astrephomene gubernaculifera]
MAPKEQKKRRQPQSAQAGEQKADKPKNDEQKPASAPAAVGEEDFPRGGADGLTALERRELTEAARLEVEQELAEGKQPKAKKARVSKQADDDDTGLGKSLEGKLAKHVELLRAKNLQPGTKVWGMVLEVTPRGLVVSLPNGLRGFVAPNKASDVLALMLKAQAGTASNKTAASMLEAAGGAVPPLTDLFVVGQFVRCVVVEGSGGQQEQQPAKTGAEGGSGGGRSSKHVALSLLLREVQGGLGSGALAEGQALGACVRSVEDHGYTLSFGIKGTSGFLRKKDHEAQFGEGVALQVGGLLDVVVRTASDPRNVLVSCAPGDVAAALTRDSESTTGLDSLLPGALLNVKVRKVLSNGLLVSFFTFFHGTIDSYHLPPAAGGAVTGPASAEALKKSYVEGAKLRARILYVDPASKRVGLTLLPHLMALSLPSPVPMLGSVFPEAEVLRLDAANGPGLLLQLPGLPEGPLAAYCHVSNALDEKVARADASAEMGKKFKPGTKLPARVIGYRLMDGMAAVTVRKTQVEAAVLSYADLAPGMIIPATVAAVPDRDGDGPLLLTVAEGVRGLVPPLHAAELSGAVTAKKGAANRPVGRVKVKVGERVEARVLEVDPAGRRLTLTLRKGLLAGKAAPLVSQAQAVPGARFHGVVTGFHDRLGVFVSFFGGLSGAAAHSDLGLEAGQTAQEVFSVGQVVKATILSAKANRIKLSLAPKSAAAAAAEAAAAAAAAAPGTPVAPAAAAGNGAGDALGGLQPGELAEAVVLEVHAGDGTGGGHYVCRLEVPGGPAGGVRGRLEAVHLSDHPAAVEAFREALKPGSRLGRVLVLDRLEAQRCVRVSRKPSLLAAAASGALPRAFSDVREGTLLPGYVASVTPDAVYVRFLAGLTGRAGLPQLSDVFVSDPRQLFSEGQSVRCQVATVDAARQRFTLLLRPSATASSDGAYLLGYLKEMRALQGLKAEAEGGAAAAAGKKGKGEEEEEQEGEDESDPSRLFPIGSLAAARVHEVREYGIVVDMDGHPDVVGLVPSSHVGPGGSSPAVGSRVNGCVLDCVGHQGLVEVSLEPRLVGAAQDDKAAAQARKKLKAGTSVEAVVEGIRPGEYLILSLPEHASLIAFAAATDYNTPRPELVPRSFTVGQRITATVAVLPPDAPAGRILCHVPLTRTGETADKTKPKGSAGSGGANKGKGGDGPKVDLTHGSVVQAVVTGIQPHQLDVSIGGGKATGRIHVTEVVDVDTKALLAAASAGAVAVDKAAAAAPAAKKARKGDKDAAAADAAAAAVLPTGSPLDGFRLQQVVEAVVLGRLQGAEGHRRGALDLSLRPSRLAVARKSEPQVPPVTLGDLVPGQQLLCFVLEVAADSLWLGAGPAVRGRCAALDASSDPAVLSDLSRAFQPGTPVLARVLAVNAKTHKLDLSLIDPSCGKTHGSVSSSAPAEGALVMGRIT